MSMFITQEASVAAHRSARNGRDHGAAAARRDGAGTDAPAKNGRGSADAARVHRDGARLGRQHAGGLEKHYWVPEKEGADFDFTMILKPLEPYRDYLTVVSADGSARGRSVVGR